MSDNLDFLTSRARTGTNRSTPERTCPFEEDEESCAAFGFLRGVRDRALVLEFRFSNGNASAFPYSWLGPVHFDPSFGLLLKFVGDSITFVLIEGSNLNAAVAGGASLYERGILRHRTTWVREMSRSQIERSVPGDVIVERIQTLTFKPDAEPKNVPWLERFGELVA